MAGRIGRAVQDPERLKKKVVGEPYEGKPHVRFEVAGVWKPRYGRGIEALSEETESKLGCPT